MKFNFKYIKELAAPGSWRRGYDYYRKGQIIKSELKNSEVNASVKGSFKDKYDITLHFTTKKVTAKCTCPLEEEWCKHAVCVGLESVKRHYYEQFLTQKTGEEFYFEEENPPEVENPRGTYKFILNAPENAKYIGIQIVDRVKNDIIKNIEVILRTIINLQKESNGTFTLNDAQMKELALLRHIFKFELVKKNVIWHNIPLNKADMLMSFLAKVEEVVDSETKKRILFKNDIWKLIFRVNVSVAGNVLLSLHWDRPDPEDTLPLEELQYFSRNAKWARYKNIIVPLDTELATLPAYLTKSTFTDIRDADGGKFVYEELPKLKKLTTVEVYEKLEQLTLEQRLPLNVLSLEKTEHGAIKATLSFEYEGEAVPYGKLAEKTPYVTIKKREEDLIYWVKRNLNYEEQAYQNLLQAKFTPTQTNNLVVEGDCAIDFYNYLLPNARETWKVIESDDLAEFKISDTPLKITADIDFTEAGDSFEINLSGAVGKAEVDYQVIQKYFQQGQKYFYLEEKGNIELPVAKMMKINAALSAVDALESEKSKFVIKTYRAGIVAELEENDVVIKMGRKFKTFWSKISSFNAMEDVPLPRAIKGELREYQKKGYNWLWFLYSYGLNGILADDMGLGKTLQALALLQKAKEKDGKAPSLVICPTSVVFNWEAEIEKFAPKLSYINITGPTRKNLFKKIEDYDVAITSYALLRRDIEDLKKFKFRIVALDESQNIKNYDSLTSKSARELNATHRLAISGTPIENNLTELWSTFDFLMPGFLYDGNEFNYRYAVPIQEKADRTVGDRLKKQVYPFILRRLKRDIAKDLPDKIENIAYCHMTPEQRDFYLDVLDSTRQEIFSQISGGGLEKNKLSVFAALLRLRQICCHPKLFDKDGQYNINNSGKFEHLKEMLEEIISENHRVLLFSQFVQMLDIIKEWLEKSGIKYEYLTGSTKDRKAVVDRFNNDSAIPIFLISLKAGGTGLNLTGADYVIHYDPWWNPAVEDQATDRAHRIGQTKNVFVYRLITKNSVEEKIMKLKERKRDLVDSVISVERDISKTLTFEDIKDILSPD
ncbi:MAG TPA: SNF2-related protein [Candidatus Gastranaerophilales bacterium]|nr:SNF2-related protein [Candidatus Gastranaerophilales bacterium]